MRYLDPAGISPTHPHLAEAYATACGSTYDVVGCDPRHLVYGDTVVTGPWGAPQWAFLPTYINIEVVPDGGDVVRTEALRVALRQRGLPTSYFLAPPKTKRAAGYEAYQEAKAWSERMEALFRTAPRIEVTKSMPPYEVVEEVERGREVLRHLATQPAAAYDYETNGLDPRKITIRALALADARDSWYLVPHVTEALKVEIGDLLHDTSVEWRASNIKYDLGVSACWQGDLPTSYAPVVDTQILHWLLRPDDFQHGLKYITKQVLKRDVLALDDIGGPEAYFDLPYDVQAVYAAAGDARNSYDLVEALKPQLQQHGMWELYTSVEQPVTPVLTEMELEGLPLSRGRLIELASEYEQRAARIQCDLKEVGFRGSPESDADIARFLFDDLGLPILVKTAKLGRGSVALDVLRMLRLRLEGATGMERGLRAVQLFIEWSEAGKALSTFLIPPLEAGGSLFKFALQQTAVKTGRLSTKPNCFDGTTEVLTPRGWVRFDALRLTDTVAQWEDGNISFVTPTQFFVAPYSGMLRHIQSTHTDLMVTPEHRCLLIGRKSLRQQVLRAERYGGDRLQLHAGWYVGGGVSWDDAQLRLVCAAQADGSYSGSAVEFRFHKGRKALRLLHALKRLGADFSRRTETRPPTNFRCTPSRRMIIRLRGEWAHWVREILGTEKCFGTALLRLRTECLYALTQEVFYWDGSYTRRNSYSSSVEDNVNWLQAAYALTGQRAHKRVYHARSGRPNYQLDIVATNYSHTAMVRNEGVPFEGTVYCVSVPSSFLVVRRGASVMITGQSQNWPEKIRDIVEAKDGDELTDADYGQIEPRIAAHLSQDPRMLAVFRGDLGDLDAYQALGVDMGFPLERLGKHSALRKNIKTVYLAEQYGCVDEATEALTSRGWRRYDELRLGELMAAYNVANSTVSWEPLLDLTTRSVVGVPMIRAKTAQSIDMLLTPDHRVVCRYGKHATVVTPARALKYGRKIPVSAKWAEVRGSEADPDVDLAYLIGLYLTDGHAPKRTHSVVISQTEAVAKNARICARIRETLARLGADWGEAGKFDPSGKRTFRISGYEGSLIRDLCGSQKQFPEGFLLWGRASLRALYEGAMDGDGSYRTATVGTFGQKDKGRRDDFHALAIRLGYTANSNKVRSDGMASVYVNERPSWRGVFGTRNGYIGEETYTGVVWCPSVASTTWVARRNGKVFITGNSSAPKIQLIALRQGEFLPLADCRDLQNGIHRARPTFYRWREGYVARTRRNRGIAVDPLFNRQIDKWRQLNAVDPGSRDAAEREVMNWPMQTGASGVIKLSMPAAQKLHREAGGSLLNMIHDELLGRTQRLTPKQRAEFNAALASSMESVVELSVPILAEVGWGRTWREAKDA